MKRLTSSSSPSLRSRDSSSDRCPPLSHRAEASTLLRLPPGARVSISHHRNLSGPLNLNEAHPTAVGLVGLRDARLEGWVFEVRDGLLEPSVFHGPPLPLDEPVAIYPGRTRWGFRLGSGALALSRPTTPSRSFRVTVHKDIAPAGDPCQRFRQEGPEPDLTGFRVWREDRSQLVRWDRRRAIASEHTAPEHAPPPRPVTSTRAQIRRRTISHRCGGWRYVHDHLPELSFIAAEFEPGKHVSATSSPDRRWIAAAGEHSIVLFDAHQHNVVWRAQVPEPWSMPELSWSPCMQRVSLSAGIDFGKYFIDEFHEVWQAVHGVPAVLLRQGAGRSCGWTTSSELFVTYIDGKHDTLHCLESVVEPKRRIDFYSYHLRDMLGWSHLGMPASDLSEADDLPTAPLYSPVLAGRQPELRLDIPGHTAPAPEVGSIAPLDGTSWRVFTPPERLRGFIDDGVRRVARHVRRGRYSIGVGMDGVHLWHHTSGSRWCDSWLLHDSGFLRWSPEPDGGSLLRVEPSRGLNLSLPGTIECGQLPSVRISDGSEEDRFSTSSPPEVGVIQLRLPLQESAEEVDVHILLTVDGAPVRAPIKTVRYDGRRLRVTLEGGCVLTAALSQVGASRKARVE